jgi:hypothetical protein
MNYNRGHILETIMPKSHCSHPGSDFAVVIWGGTFCHQDRTAGSFACDHRLGRLPSGADPRRDCPAAQAVHLPNGDRLPPCSALSGYLPPGCRPGLQTIATTSLISKHTVLSRSWLAGAEEKLTGAIAGLSWPRLVS